MWSRTGGGAAAIGYVARRTLRRKLSAPADGICGSTIRRGAAAIGGGTGFGAGRGGGGGGGDGATSGSPHNWRIAA